jgi:MFS superfamily sulfate permease-like transporter
MLAGIGVIIILKQIPHAFGYDANFEGDQSFIQSGSNSFSSLFEVLIIFN